MKDPYAVLGLSRNSDPETIKAKYKELRALYGEQRFKAGEEGNEGARKLQELEEAWVIVSADLEKSDGATPFGGDYSYVDQLIRTGKYNEAQEVLDSITDRKGEWHYMQAIVFYKREWLSEAKTQLEMAVRDEPGNQKYRTSLDKLKMTMSGGDFTAPSQPTRIHEPYSNVNGEQRNAGYDRPSSPVETPMDMANCLSTCCCAYCLTDCLCQSMRCC